MAEALSNFSPQKMLKDRLSKSSIFNSIKDICSGTHEKNVFHIVRSWLKKENYKSNQEEWKVIRKGYFQIAAFTMVGAFFPCVVLIFPTIRPLVYGSSKQRHMFHIVCGTLAYINYNSGYAALLYNMLQLNNSPYSYCIFQVLCLPEYKRFRNKWQSSYNLSAIAHRYQYFDLYQAMYNPISMGLDIDIGTDDEST